MQKLFLFSFSYTEAWVFPPLCKRQLQALTITEPCLPTKTDYLHSNIVVDAA